MVTLWIKFLERIYKGPVRGVVSFLHVYGIGVALKQQTDGQASFKGGRKLLFLKC